MSSTAAIMSAFSGVATTVMPATISFFMVFPTFMVIPGPSMVISTSTCPYAVNVAMKINAGGDQPALFLIRVTAQPIEGGYSRALE